MNQKHHEVLFNELIDHYAEYIGISTNPLIYEGIEVLQQYREIATQYVSAPDRIKDTALKMVWCLPDKTSVAGHNLSAFQHFICPQYNYQGYCWDRDESLGWIDEIIDLPVKWFHSHIHATLDKQTEFPPVSLAYSPIAISISHKTKFNKFVFPSAAEVAKYHTLYLPTLYKMDKEMWAKEVAFAMHFLMDAHVPHHVFGWLLNGHQEWEDELEKKWNSWDINNVSPPEKVLPKNCSIDYFIRSIASYTYNLFKNYLPSVKEGEVTSETAIFTCNRTIRNCGLALDLCLPTK